jgi:predicted ATPase
MFFHFDKIKCNGFKLISLELFDVKPFGSLKYSFIDQNDLQDKIYTTLIIGRNGTGKSNLFRLLIDIFKSIDDIKNNKMIDAVSQKRDNLQFRKGSFELVYSLDGKVFNITRESFNQSNGFAHGFKIDGVLETDFSKMLLPDRIIANSFSITDKFPFYKNSSSHTFNNYKYLGVKYNPQSASTKAYLKRTIDFIADESTFTDEFVDGLNLIAKDFVGDNKTINISYKPQNIYRFFTGKLTLEMLEEFFDEINVKYTEKEMAAPFKLSRFSKLLKSEKQKLIEAIEFCNQLVNEHRFFKKQNNSAFGILTFDLTSSTDFENLKKENNKINILTSIGLFSLPKLEFYTKEGLSYSLEEASSGEHNLITSLIGLLATITPNSFILIDEPEISLHPHWQMKYIAIIKKIFSNSKFNSCHALIASHSHFLVSDLEKNSSKIIGLKKNEKLEVIDFPEEMNTFGWSAEDVLFRVFNLHSVRNHYFEMAVADLLNLLYDKSTDYQKIKIILKELKLINRSENDPLNELIEETEDYIKKNATN